MVVKGITKRWLLNSLGVILILIVALVFSLSYAIQNYIYYGIQQAINGRAGELTNVFSDYGGNVLRRTSSRPREIMWRISPTRKAWS